MDPRGQTILTRWVAHDKTHGQGGGNVGLILKPDLKKNIHCVQLVGNLKPKHTLRQELAILATNPQLELKK